MPPMKLVQVIQDPHAENTGVVNNPGKTLEKSLLLTFSMGVI